MLANLKSGSQNVGQLAGDIPKPASFRLELIDFIASELPAWRDRDDRPKVTSETLLTSQICAHLNSRARHSGGWDILQFRVEETDEVQAGRKIDLVAAPSGTSITIEGRRHIDFDTLMPIECKRLPTPQGATRDEMEYVINRTGTTGGVQRFKLGLHGAAHSTAAIIGYVQEKDCEFWDQQIARWIGGLIGIVSTWEQADLLNLNDVNKTSRTARLGSRHARPNDLGPIELHHLWMEIE